MGRNIYDSLNSFYLLMWDYIDHFFDDDRWARSAPLGEPRLAGAARALLATEGSDAAQYLTHQYEEMAKQATDKLAARFGELNEPELEELKLGDQVAGDYRQVVELVQKFPSGLSDRRAWFEKARQLRSDLEERAVEYAKKIPQGNLY